MYKDMAAKLKYHKEKIIQGFIDLGIYPTDDRIKGLINSIDMGLPYLVVQEAESGENFNCKAYNQMVNSIYRDLKLLYELYQELALNKYYVLKSFIDSHLDDLQEKANFYKTKAIQETNATALGTTLFYQNKNYNLSTHNNSTLIDLGTIKFHQGSRIACLFDANNVKADQVIFSLKKDDENILYGTPYNYNQNSIVIPGRLKTKEYDYEKDKNLITEDLIKINLPKISINKDNKYTILSGKNKIFIKTFDITNDQYFKEAPTTIEAVHVKSKKIYIDFYTVNANTIQFKFNKKPLKTNFSYDNYMVTNLDYVHHFFIEAEEDFTFNFSVDQGEIYAVKGKGIITDDELYFSKKVSLNDFHIISYETNEQEEYNVQIIVKNYTSDKLNIESIMIKELLEME